MIIKPDTRLVRFLKALAAAAISVDFYYICDALSHSEKWGNSMLMVICIACFVGTGIYSLANLISISPGLSKTLVLSLSSRPTSGSSAKTVMKIVEKESKYGAKYNKKFTYGFLLFLTAILVFITVADADVVYRVAPFIVIAALGTLMLYHAISNADPIKRHKK